MSFNRIRPTILLAVVTAVAAAAAPTAPPRAAPPATVSGLLTLGSRLAARADYDAAKIAYRQVLDNPAAPAAAVRSALLGLAATERQEGSLTKAAAIYERFLHDYPDDAQSAEALLDLGRTLRALGAYKMAIARFYDVINSALKLTGRAFEQYRVLARTAEFEIAQTHFAAGEFADAAKDFTRLTDLDLAPPDRARAAFKAAYALQLEGKLEPAAKALQAYLAQWPQDEHVPQARYLLALTLRALGRPGEALAETLTLLRAERAQAAADPKNWGYWQRKTGNQLANDFFAAGDITQATAIYAALLPLADDPAWRVPILYQLGLCHERLGDPDRASGMYQKLLDAVGATPGPEFAELARMAAWRRQQITWSARVDHDLARLFTPTTGPAPAPPPATPPVANTP